MPDDNRTTWMPENMSDVEPPSPGFRPDTTPESPLRVTVTPLGAADRSKVPAAADNRYAARRVLQASGDGLVAVRRERDKPDGGPVQPAAGADGGTVIGRPLASGTPPSHG